MRMNPLDFDASDAWLMFSIYLMANEHYWSAFAAALILLGLLYLTAQALINEAKE